tara:strand:+ start:4968 stop:5732 length:765 start_codon:yes stop_codon:yes gene_type:complete
MSGAATILAAVAAAGALTSAGMSFSQAKKARKDAKTAKIRAEKLRAEARRNLEKLKYSFDELNIPLDVYKQAEDSVSLTQKMSIQALQEGDPRNLAAGIGAVNQVGVDSLETIRTDKAKDLYDHRKWKLEKKMEVDDELITMGLGEAKGLFQESQDLEESANQAVISGVQSIGSAAATMSDASSTFGKGKQAKAITDVSTDIATTKPFENFSKGDISSFLKKNVSQQDLYDYQQDSSLFDFSVIDGEMVFKRKS